MARQDAMISVDVELWAKFKAYAALKRRPASHIIEDCIRAILVREPVTIGGQVTSNIEEK